MRSAPLAVAGRGRMNMKRISVDWEFAAEDWWMAAQTDQHTPAAFAPMLADNTDSITVSDDEADQIIAWATNLPGWDDGPEYAVHPLIVHDA
jgi:hypothetical protein